MRDMFATRADLKLELPRRQETPLTARFGIAALAVLCGIIAYPKSIK